jgi:hypothetical protein
MKKFIATRLQKTDVCPVEHDWCTTACQRCSDCKRESRGWSECWSACDECNRCHAKWVRADIYNDPYNYSFPWTTRTLATTPALAKQFCSNICGVNMCKAFRERYDGYVQCKRCQQRGQCWSQYQGRCVDCPREQAFRSCEEKWGCPNPHGSQTHPVQRFVPPIDPMYTDCTPCWNQLSYTT